MEPEAPFQPTARQIEIIGKIADWVVRRRLTLPAVMALESVTPLNYLGSQALVFFQPFATTVLDSGAYKEFQAMLEHRGSIDWMVGIIETREIEWTRSREQKNSTHSAKE